MSNEIFLSNNLEIWIPAAVSVITLIINMFFYIFVQPKLTYKATSKESLKNISVDLLNYLAEIVSYDSFEGVPTKIRKYSLQIHLHFKKGIADEELEKLLEKIYSEVKERKRIIDNTEIYNWNEEFRKNVRELRFELAKYCGTL